MTRPLFIFAMLAVFAGPAAPAIPRAQAQSPSHAELAQTAELIARRQNPDGGFGRPSTLGATSSSIRILKYVGGSIPDPIACASFVKSCFDEASGGFAQTPKGKPDVATTASGLMAMAELKMPAEPILARAANYFSKNVKSFEDLRIAAAGFEAYKAQSPDFDRWTKQVLEDRQLDGTFGQGDARPFATGGAVAALLRMGFALEETHKTNALQAMRDGQMDSGAWSEGPGRPANLAASYRIMRAFWMLKEKPKNLEGLAAFIAKCRNEDGSYRVSPDAAQSDGTYLAAIITRWIRELSGQPVFVETAGFQPLFNGQDLKGWEGDSSLWSVKNGVLTGASESGLKKNNFLATEADYEDFVLKLTFRLRGQEDSNSGVQFRSVRIPNNHEMRGYQADIGKGYWGSLYDESRRNRVLVKARPQAEASVRLGDWNHYVIRGMGDQITLALNGIPSIDYKETDSEIARTGKIATQIHSGGPMTVEFKDVLIQPLPSPKTALDGEPRPGFWVRTLKRSQGGDRKYTIYVPKGYDGLKSLPVVLFLHGSGERGDDGVRPAQVGLGPAVLANPDFPCVVVFPQARQTWRADSDDAKAALEALDDAIGFCKADKERVTLTGLSMGGAGTWSIAAALPDRFQAIAPICGIGDPGSVAAFANKPVWCFVGDDDRDRTVHNSREMVEALRKLKANIQYSEYRGVGHNSWDRAYNEPRFVAWLLAPCETKK